MIISNISTVYAQDIDEGLIAYWRFNEGQGTLAHDDSVNGYNGTIVGATWIDGISNKALDFDGIGDYVNTTNFGLQAPLTISVWVKTRGSSQSQTIFGRNWRYIGVYHYQHWLFLTHNNYVAFGDRPYGVADDWVISTQPLENNQWYHIVVTRASSSDIKIYINGVLDNSGSTSTIGNHDTPYRIGTINTGHYPFNGVIDELRIYDLVLSEDQIEHLAKYYGCQYSLAGDLNNDCSVTLWDLNMLKSDWLMDCNSLSEDDFNDNLMDPMWRLYNEDPNKCWVEETNQRLELHATSDANDVIALYISNGWALDVSEDFTLKVNFYYDVLSWEDGGIFIGLGPDPNDPRNNYVDIVAGCDEEAPYFWYGKIVGGTYEDYLWEERDEDSGTLYISYDAALDELYLSYDGYGSANAWATVSDLLQGDWSGQPVYVGLGGEPPFGVSLDGSGSYLDNFVIESGDVLCPNLIGDLNGDGIVNLLDFAIQANNWLINCNTNPSNPACVFK